MTDDLITDLSKISGLFVIARNSVFTYKDKPVKIKQVGRELGVRFVLEGSVRKVGHKVRINAQLIDAATDNHLWADRYDDDLNDVFALQDRITRKIVSALSIKLTANEQEQVSRKHTDNLEAYDFFLRGKQLYYSLNIDVIDEAKAMFSKAIELDPQFALAYAFHARANWHKSTAVPESSSENLAEASEYVRKALNLDDTLPEAHTVLSLLQLNNGLHDEAIASAAKAVAMDYNNAESYLYQANVLTRAGKHDEAFDSINKAFRLNPNPPALYYYGLARIQFNRRQYIEALNNLKKAPDSFTVTLELKVPVFAYAGLLEEAGNELKNILKISPNYNLKAIRNTSKYRLMEDIEHHLEGFRMAGL
jgi:tetratricopeptide (TPR) repeat protein